MTDTKFLEVPLEQLSTSQLADRADSHNSAAYADLSEQDLPEDKFRADLQFSHIFRCVELTSDDGQGYNQISIRPLHGDNLLERLRMAELEVSIES